jgi:dolichol kinase
VLTQVEIQRKIVHLLGLAIPIGYSFTSEETAVTVILFIFLAFLAVDLLRFFHRGTASLFNKFIYGKVLREGERVSLMGSTYYLFSALLTILLFPKPIAIVSILILILSDTCAALVGKGIGRVRIFHKTLEGTVAFFLSALIIVLLHPGVERLPGALGALGAGVIELLPIPLDDNLTIPFAAGAIMFFCKG